MLRRCFNIIRYSPCSSFFFLPPTPRGRAPRVLFSTFKRLLLFCIYLASAGGSRFSNFFVLFHTTSNNCEFGCWFPLSKFLFFPKPQKASAGRNPSFSPLSRQKYSIRRSSRPSSHSWLHRIPTTPSFPYIFVNLSLQATRNTSMDKEEV